MKNTDAYWFGKNWKQFLVENYSDEQLLKAEKSLKSLFGEDGLAGKTFLNIGCGSGLFSLAAWRLAAAQITGVDVDLDSIKSCWRIASQVDKKRLAVNGILFTVLFLTKHSSTDFQNAMSSIRGVCCTIRGTCGGP